MSVRNTYPTSKTVCDSKGSYGVTVLVGAVNCSSRGHLDAMRALTEVCERLGLDYAGIDFALSPDGSVLLFEANATMVVNPPGADPMWDYRRPAVRAVLEASARMLDP